MTKHLLLDIETYSEADLRSEGLYRYAAHPSTLITLVSYAWGVNAPVQTWAYDTDGEPPADLIRALRDPGVLKVAHNAAFERVVMGHVLFGAPLPPDDWLCTMAWAFSLSLPGSLADLCGVLGVGDEARKLTGGNRLIARFAMPDRDGKRVAPDEDPDKWLDFLDYSRHDVTALQAVVRRMAKWPMTETERSIWCMDQRINERGWPIDRELVAAALAVRELDEARGMERSRDISKLDNPNSRDQMIGYLAERGIEVENLTKATVRDLLWRDDLTPEVRELLELRQGLSKTSIKKFASLHAATGHDGRIRGTLQYSGASRTGRWAGRIFQPQNLASAALPDDELESAIELVKTRDEALVRMVYSNTADMLSRLIRPSVCAPPGRVLVAVDYASIESVMLAWAARAKPLLRLYRDGRDPYKDFASKRFGVRYDDVTKAQRKWAKPAVLGCGYMLGANGLVAYADGFGTKLSEDEAREAVATYRESYPEIPELWFDLDRAMRAAMNGHTYRVGAIVFEPSGPFVRMVLPSGRALHYLSPRIEERKTPWGAVKPQITYRGREHGNQMGRIATHPGKIAENLVQALARDLLADGLLTAQAAGLDVIGHVHDEIVVECDEAAADATLATLIHIMSQPPKWCADAPIKGTGWAGRRYRKD